MEVRRVARYGSPRYPAKAALGPESRLVPKRWQGNARMTAGRAASQTPGKMAPARFLTETEARRIVIAEGKRAHVGFRMDGRTIPIDLPSAKGKRHVAYRIKAWDKKHRLGFSFVTPDDASRLLGAAAKTGDLEKVVKDGLVKEHLGGRVRLVGIDPYGDSDAQKAKLRHEVRSFIAWLKAQGVI